LPITQALYYALADVHGGASKDFPFTLDKLKRLAPTAIAGLTAGLIGQLKLVAGANLGRIIADVRALNTQAALAGEKTKR